MDNLYILRDEYGTVLFKYVDKKKCDFTIILRGKYFLVHGIHSYAGTSI
jgi:hypothetical protein